MASERILEEKKQVVSEIADKIKNNNSQVKLSPHARLTLGA